METIEQWLKNKKFEFEDDKLECLTNMLLTTTEVIEQYLMNPNKSNLYLIEQCVKCNKYFIDKNL